MLGTRMTGWPRGCHTPVAFHGMAGAVTSCTLVLYSPSPLKDDDDAPSRSKAWTPGPQTPGWQTPRRAWTPACRTPALRTPACRTPHHASSSFVGSVLKAVAGKGELASPLWVLERPRMGIAPSHAGMCRAGHSCCPLLSQMPMKPPGVGVQLPRTNLHLCQSQ